MPTITMWNWFPQIRLVYCDVLSLFNELILKHQNTKTDLQYPDQHPETETEPAGPPVEEPLQEPKEPEEPDGPMQLPLENKDFELCKHTFASGLGTFGPGRHPLASRFGFAGFGNSALDDAGFVFVVCCFR